MKLFLVVYIDDFKLAGPKGKLSEGWKISQAGLQIKPPTPLGIFLGCDHRRREVKLPGGAQAVMMECDMACLIGRYKELVPGVRLPPADTPFLPEDQAYSPYSKPVEKSGKGKIYECPHCYGSIHEKRVYENVKDYEASAAKRMGLRSNNARPTLMKRSAANWPIVLPIL